MMLILDSKTHKYFDNGVEFSGPSVTEILDGAGLVDKTWFNGDGILRGTYVHKAIKIFHDKGLNFDSLDSALRPYVDAYLKFISESSFRPILVERPFSDDLYGFAGTPDLVGYLNGKLAVIDIKTGVPQNWAALQTAAYAYLIGRSVEGMPVQARYALQLKDNGNYSLLQHKGRNDFKVFIAAMTIFNFKKGKL